jgi:hypothetical protein
MTNFPDTADAESLPGISKSFNSSVVVDDVFVTLHVTVPDVLVTLAICANNTIAVYEFGAVYIVASVFVNSAVTVLNMFNATAISYPSLP